MRERCCASCNFSLAEVLAERKIGAVSRLSGQRNHAQQPRRVNASTAQDAADLAELDRYKMSRPIGTQITAPNIQNGTMIDNDAFLFTHPASNRTAILCLHAKAGSSTWLRFQLHTLGIQAKDPHRIVTQSLSSLMQPPRRPIQEILQDPRVPRITIVRNPFARLLSGYLDKMVVNSTAPSYKQSVGYKLWEFERMKPGHGWFSMGDNFSRFVQAVVNSPKVNRHFELQSQHCALPNGLLWDYALHLEDAAAWYTPFVRLLQLERVVGTLRLVASTAVADSHLDGYYTESLASIVALWAQADFEAFQYSPWPWRRVATVPSTYL